MSIKTLANATAIFVAGATTVSAQEACTTYIVKSGDSLSAIARSAYGNISYRSIWDANREAIGANPNDISVGLTLEMPCLDGTLPSKRTSATETNTSAAVDTPVENTVTLRLVTGTDFPPYTDEGMQGGGIYTQLVRAALDSLGDSVDGSIVFVNDWDPHLETLLPSGTFDGSFPWYAPNCSADVLSENTQFRCDNYIQSDPFYEIVAGFIVQNGSPLGTTTSYEDFHGTKICFPEGYTDATLTSVGLVEPVVTYVRPTDPDDCMAALAAGEVDAAQLEFSQAEAIADRLGITDKVAVNDILTEVNLLTVYVYKDNPEASQVLATLNSGLANIRESGVWFETVRSGLSAYYSK